MKVRPWPIVILSFFYMIEPFVRVIVHSYIFDYSISHAINSIISGKHALYNLFVLSLFPLSGMAIFSFKRWSLPVFLTIQLIIAVTNYDFLKSYFHQGQFIQYNLLILLYLSNLFIVIYFFLPSVREIYVNPRLRWWEPKDRYKINLICRFSPIGHEKETLPPDSPYSKVGTIINISETGVFLKSYNQIEEGKLVQLNFSYAHIDYSFTGKIVDNRSFDKGHGVQFVNMTLKQRLQIRNLIRNLKFFNYETCSPNISKINDFKSWISLFVKTGKGIVPETSAPKTHSTNTDKKSNE